MAVVCNNRSRLLLGCGATALAVALTLAPERASAQAFQATPNVVQGNANIDRGSPGSDLIEITTPTAVIDWTPDEDAAGNALDFLPAGHIASFYDAPNQGGFAVLNRILPSTNGNVVVMNGTVISSLQGPIPGAFTPGGFVAFYSPTGFLIGSTAVFDVGGLMLTTLNPDLASFDNFAVGAGSLNLIGQTGTTARITISPGANIIATPENGFMIAAAAGVDVFGDVQVNGSHAYIAAEQVNLTVNNGLFDIVIPVGTSVGNAMNINGNVGGPSSTGAGDNHLIYAVAQAAANPIQMLFGGNLGFAPAASAGVINGEIILAANYDVFGRTVNGGSVSDGTLARFVSRAETSTTQADIFVTDANISSSTLAIGTHLTQVTAQNGPAVVDGNLQVIARQNANLTASNGQTYLITGDVLVASDDAGVIGSSLPDPTAIDASAGLAFIDAFGGGTLSINGNAVVSADAFSGAETINQVGGSASGGQAQLGSTGGTLNIGGEALVSAQAVSNGVVGLLDAGTMDGGLAQIFSTLGGDVTIDGDATVLAGALGTNVAAGATSAGGSAAGGTALINIFNGAGSLTFNGNLLADASATAGAGNANTTGGTALAGEANINTNDAGALIDVAGDVTLLSEAFGSRNFGGRGGDATGGFARMGTSLGTINVDGAYRAAANAFGGEGIDGGIGTGGFAGVFSDRGAVTIGTDVEVRANGRGGDASLGIGGQGGIGQGGLAFLDAARSALGTAALTIQGNALVESLGFGGAGGIAGPSAGGPVAAGQGGDGFGGLFGPPNAVDPAFSNGAYALAQADFGTLTVTGSLTVRADGTGGVGGAGDSTNPGGTGGQAAGGTAQAGTYLSAGNGSTALGSASFGIVTVTSRGTGGDGGSDISGGPSGIAGTGTGGFAGLVATFGDVTAGAGLYDATGRGGTGSVGGNGIGGTAGFDLQNGAAVTAGASVGLADGFGGASTNGAAGNGTGGLALFNVVNGILQLNGSLELSAFGSGGIGTGGVGGNGIGGGAGGSVTTGSASITGILLLNADGSGGVSVDHSGGNGTGGRARASTFGGTITIGSDFSTTAQGIGGAGTDGGDGTGGIAGAFAGTGSVTINGSLTATTRGFGGNASFGFGGQGGIGTGGNAFAQANGTLTTDASVTILGNANILADGTGGRGGDSDGSDFNAGNGGDGLGGSIGTVNAADSGFNNGAYLLAQGDRGSVTVGGLSQVFAVGLGGNGGNGQGLFDGGTGGNGVGGTAQGGMFIGTGNGSVSAGQVQLGDAVIRATGIGGNGGLDSTLGFATGDGGDGTGGGAFLTARLSTVQAGVVTIESDGTGGTGATGGAGLGGTAALLTTNGGTATLSQLFAYTRGAGGFGQAGSGGTGTGGESFIGFHGGTTNITGNATIVADGFGGQSIGADGATGTGGLADIATFDAVAGTATIGGTAQVTANGIGGETLGTGFTGGNGLGGEAYLLTQVGGTLQINAAQVAANGVGGSGPSATGGNGTGGRAYIESRDAGSAITIQNAPANLFGNFTQSAVLVATGAGGNTTGGTGIGGTGTGGVIDILATTGGTINLPATGGPTGLVPLFARGFGGGSSVDGGVGGLGTGGTGTIDVDGGTLVGGPLHFSMFASGGSSLNTSHNVTGGNGVGGNRFIIVQNGGVLTAAFPGGVAGGDGGDGSGTGAGGNASGGLATLEVIGGTANLGSGSIMIAQNFGGNGATGGNAQGGLATVLVDDGGVINILPDPNGPIGTFLVGSNSFGGVGTTGAGGNATPQAASVVVTSGAINGGRLSIEARATGGSSTSGAGGNAIAGNSGLTINGGAIATQEVIVDATAIGGISSSGANGNAVGGTAAVTLASGQYATTGSTTVLATGTTGSSTVTGGTGGNATGGTATFEVAGGAANPRLLTVNAGAIANANGQAAAGTAALIIATGSVNALNVDLFANASSNQGLFARGGRVELGGSSSGNLLASIVTLENRGTGAATGAATNGNIAGSALVEAVSGAVLNSGSLRVNSFGGQGGGPIELVADNGNITTRGDFSINGSQNVLVSVVNGGQFVSTGNIGVITTRGTISIAGNNDNNILFGAARLVLTSSELDIGSGARIGADSVELNSLNQSATAILGGSTEEPGYTLTNTEAERIEANSVSFTAPVVSGIGANDPDVLIRDLTIAGTLDDGVSSVSLSTQGIVRVEGQLIYQDAGSTDSLEIFAAQRLEVVTPGGIAMVDSDGGPAGLLSLTSENIWVGDADLIGQLQSDPNFTGRDDLLKTAATGSDDPLGYLRGGSIDIGVGTSLFVRNTGTESEQGGILIGDGTLSIRAVSLQDSQPTAITVFAYGAKQNPDGTLVTGEAFYDLVNFNKAATASGGPGTSYNDGSFFNDCDINTDECQSNTEEIIEMAPPVNNPAVVEAPTAEPDPVPPAEEETSAEFGVDFPGLVEVTAVTEEGTLDDGVMSGGDSSLYSAAEDDEDEDEENDGGE